MALAGELFATIRLAVDMPVPPPPAPAQYVGHAMAQRFTPLSQVFLNIADPLVPASPEHMPHPRWRVAAALASNLFGGGMSSPLVDTVREQLGLAYTAHSTMDSGDVWANFVVHAVTTPDKLDALVAATGELLRAQAAAIDPVHLERAKNQLTVSRVRAAERTYATMEQAVEELFASGAMTPMAEAMAMIEDIAAEEVRAVFQRMLVNPRHSR